MQNRVALIEEKKPDLVVSIHQNSFSASTKGAQVFYHKSSEKGKRLAGILQQSIKEKADKENHRVEKAECQLLYASEGELSDCYRRVRVFVKS